MKIGEGEKETELKVDKQTDRQTGRQEKAVISKHVEGLGKKKMRWEETRTETETGMFKDRKHVGHSMEEAQSQFVK